MKKLLLIGIVLLIAMLGFVGCQNAEEDEPDVNISVERDPQASEIFAGVDAILERFPAYFNDGGEHVPGTTLMYGLSSPTPWLGIIGGAVFSTAAICSEIAGFLGTGSSILSTTPDYTFGQDGIANFELDLPNNRITFNMQQDVYWHDGVPLTLADLAFAYYILADPDYTGIRFSTGERRVQGIMDYHDGYADYISGLVLSNNDRTLTIYFEEMSPEMLYFGIWTAPVPRHIFENIPVADMAASPYVREHPVGWGPFIIERVIPGESVYMRRNENYVWGAPYIENIVIERFAPELAGTHMEAGTYDFMAFGSAFYEDYSNPTNFRFLASIDEGYNFLAFRLGHFNWDTWENEYSPNRNMSSPVLRQAMALAIDETTLGEYLFSGLQVQAASFLPPNHVDLMDFDVPILGYDPERARQMLDEAGFLDIDGSGYRSHPDGSPLTVIWAYATGPLEDTLVPFYTQSWREIGIRVELWRGMTHDIFYLWDVLDFDEDDDEIDIYMAAWTNLFNPEPSGRWGHDVWNPSRYNSPEWEAIQARLISQDAWDREYMRAAYSAMQWYMYENAFAIPTRWSTSLVAVNNRVSRWDTRIDAHPSGSVWHLVRLTAEEPYRR